MLYFGQLCKFLNYFGKLQIRKSIRFLFFSTHNSAMCFEIDLEHPNFHRFSTFCIWARHVVFKGTIENDKVLFI